MTHEHFTVTLGAFTHRRRFKPFFIEFASGDRILVTHPEVVILRQELWEYVDPEERHHVFESEGVIRLFDAPEPTAPE